MSNDSNVNCPACSDLDSPRTRSRCDICHGTGECSELEDARYEIQRLRVERLALNADLMRVRAQLDIYRPVFVAAQAWQYGSAEWRNGKSVPPIEKLRETIQKAEAELVKLAKMMGVAA